MKKTVKIGMLSALTAMLLVGCGSSSDNSNTTADSGYKAKFEARPVNDQVEELMGGVIGIADEVGHGKMAEPLGEDKAHADTTLVESQFSWNSTMDFYNNILSIKHVWDGGLEKIANDSQPALATTITAQLDDALADIVAISDKDLNGKLETNDLIADDGAEAFRNQILNDAGREKIKKSIDALAKLQGSLETLKTKIAPTEVNKADVKAVVDNVIVKGYNNLGTEAAKLEQDLNALIENPTDAKIAQARTQWRATRQYWESGEGYIFGPVDTLGVDPKVDSWPVDKTQLDGALEGWDPELSNIDGFPTTMKGFHAIEYLLFGDGSTLESEDAALIRLQDKKKRQYIAALGKSFAKDIKALTDAWK